MLVPSARWRFLLAGIAAGLPLGARLLPLVIPGRLRDSDVGCTLITAPAR